jgi:zinc protease
VLVIEDASVPLATVEINVKNGSYTEPPEFNGLSHFYEHMFFKANRDLPSQESYIKRTNELGIAWNGTTSVERVNYFFTLPSRNQDDGLQFMNSAIRYPLFLEEEIQKEHAVVNGEFQRAESDPEFHLWMDWDKKMWGADYCRKNPIGDHDVIFSATPDMMKTIQQKYYWPNNSLLTVAGDVKHEEVFEKVKAMYSDWKAADFDPQTKWPIPEFEPIKEDINYVTVNENAKNPVIALGWQGPDTRRDIKNTYVADVFSTIISQESSRLHKELVDAGLALEISLGYSTAKYTGPIQMRIVPNPKKIKECIAKINENIKEWDSGNYFTDEQLATAKKELDIQNQYRSESTSSYCHTVGYWWSIAGVDYLFTYSKNVNDVTKDDIKKYVQRYIKDKPKVSGLLLSPGLQQSMSIKNYEDILN